MKISKERLLKIIKEEIGREFRGYVNEAGARRMAGLTTADQIEALDKDFQFSKKPTNYRLKVIQDIQDPNKGLVFDGEEMIGELDLSKNTAWFNRILKFSPGEVDQALEYYKNRNKY